MVPANTSIEFFVPDNYTLQPDTARCFDTANLTHGITDEIIQAAQLTPGGFMQGIRRRTFQAGQEVKNYRLQSILGDWSANTVRFAVLRNNVWTPGKEDSDQDAEAMLRDIALTRAGAMTDPPLVLQWCACTTHCVGEDQANNPVEPGKRVGARSSSCCYISTATCLSLGLGDDCGVLDKLRQFRDQVLRQDSRAAADVATYYATAPAIVGAIAAMPDPPAVYRDIYATYLVPALAAIDRGDHARAFRIYRRMVEQLSRRFLHREPQAAHGPPIAERAQSLACAQSA